MFILSLKGAIYGWNLSSSVFKVRIKEWTVFHKFLIVCLFDCFQGGCWQPREFIVTLLSDKFRLFPYKRTNADAQKNIYFALSYHISLWISSPSQNWHFMILTHSDTFSFCIEVSPALFERIIIMTLTFDCLRQTLSSRLQISCTETQFQKWC